MSDQPRHAIDIRPVPEGLILRLLGEGPTEKIRAAGLSARAVRCMALHPEERVLRKALVCRLYPVSDQARLSFFRAGLGGSNASAETTVFPDPDDDLEQSLLEGFHNSMVLANALLEGERQ